MAGAYLRGEGSMSDEPPPPPLKQKCPFSMLFPQYKTPLKDKVFLNKEV